MAEAALLGLAKSVLGQLSCPALNEFLLLWNSKKDLKKLGETIETIKCFIHDAERKQSNEDLVKLWLSRLRAVLYDADDLFDTIAAMALRKKAIGGSAFKKEVTLFFSKSNQLGFVIKTAHEIKVIRECLDGIEKDMSTCKLQYHKIEEKRPHNVLEREERHSYVDSKEVIGRDKEKEEIVELLMREDDRQQNLEVISVIGFGGLGKTTLAQFVYNDPRVQTGFDLCLWTCINYLSDLESVLVKILTSVLKSKPQDLDLDQLQRELREKIREKKYLLVVDDVWDENHSNWSRLRTLLNCGKMGSKVLITTRKKSVARCLDAKEPYYRLNVLSEESAWFLFVKMAFKDGEFNENDAELVSTGKQILHKCGYAPLAVSIIGSMLRSRKKDKEEWSSFLEKEFGGVVSDDADDGNLMQVLKVSYNDLPLALKHCFAYCSVFPKDHGFSKDELVRMWIAQGFIEPHAKKSLEEVAEDYFFHLVDRCFFQEIEEYSWSFGVVKITCKMHDLLHDLAVQVAGSESKCFQAEDLRDNVEMSDLRHISVTCLPNSSSFYSSISSHSKSLRTLRFIEPEHIEISSLELALNKFRKLRTLVLSFLNFEALPDSFGGLIHLRYLDLSHNSNLIALPNSICKLYHLQILLLTYCASLVKLPSNLTKLVSLRHLVLKGCRKLDSMPSGFAALTTLVSLDRFIVHPNRGTLRCLVREGLQFLTSLEELGITYYEEQQVKIDNEDPECCRAMSWSGLEKLQIVTLIFQGMTCCFPKWTLHLPCLQDLGLWDCGEMNVDDWVGQQTQSNSLLELLISTNKESLLWIHDIPWKLLPSLCGLEIDGKLSSIPDGIQQLTSLQDLIIWDREKIKEIPKWMINLASLQCLTMYYCSPELQVRCERETGVDWHLISHIPSIRIE